MDLNSVETQEILAHLYSHARYSCMKELQEKALLIKEAAAKAGENISDKELENIVKIVSLLTQKLAIMIETGKMCKEIEEEEISSIKDMLDNFLPLQGKLGLILLLRRGKNAIRKMGKE